MITAQGMTAIELDRLASEPRQPYGIITVDCSSPYEYDDGISVEPLPAATETYRVGVFAVDTSRLYDEESVTKRVLGKTQSYYRNHGTELEEYDPMLDEEVIQKLHFSQGKIRSAFHLSFVIGRDQPPTDLTTGFGKVEVVKNFNYRSFEKRCRLDKPYQSHARAAAMIIHHLQAGHQDVESAYDSLMNDLDLSIHRRGSNINQAFMVGGNHLLGRLTRDEGELAIYRTHDTTDDTFTDIMSPRLGRYSTMPGNHDGLGLDVYTRFTSPLRRLEDFIMLGLRRAYHEKRPLTGRDLRLVSTAVQRLNQRTIVNLFNGRLRTRDEDLWVVN